MRKTHPNTAEDQARVERNDMSEPKFTPGPWVVITPKMRHENGDDWQADDEWTEEYPNNVSISARWETPVNGCLGYGIAEMSGVHEAIMPNARLIASAPELYEALRVLFYEIHGDCGEANCRPCGLARAALAKAVAQ